MELLALVEKLFPSVRLPYGENEPFLPAGEPICHELGRVGSDLMKIVQLSLPRDPFAHTYVETLVHKTAAIQLAEFRCRPESKYYVSTGQPIPSPENKGGPRETGIELSLAALRGYSNARVSRPACVVIEFQVLGKRERECFRELFTDHRRSIEKILSSNAYNFHTACVFSEIERYRGRDAFGKLVRYCASDEDGEDNFSLSAEFGGSEPISEVVRSAVPLAMLYRLTYGYCQSPKRRDLAYEYLRSAS